MGKKILAVGCAGYIGGWVVDTLLKDGHDIIVYDSLLFNEDYLKPGVEFVRGDIRDKNKLIKYLRSIDAVVFLAAMVGDGAAALNPEVSLSINCDSLRWLNDHFDGRIITTSSCSVYGAQEGILTENSLTNPLSLYAYSKVETEKILKNSNSLIYRLGTLFGVADHYSRIRLDLVANVMTMKAFFEKRIKVFGKTQYRPFLHVKDAAEQIAKTIFTNRTGVYNLHYQNIQLLDLSHQIRGHFNDVEIDIQDMPVEDQRNYRVDSSAAKRYLDFEPRRTIDDGIVELKTLFEEGRIKDPYNLRYHNHNFLKEHPEYLEFKPTETKRDFAEELKGIKLTSLI